MTGFSRFTKQWASTGAVLNPTDSQANAGFAFLGATPPSVELFNSLMQSLDDKDNTLFNWVAAVMSAASITPADATPGQLLAAIRTVSALRVNVQVIASSTTYTPDSKLISALVRGIAGGGGGGGAFGAASPNVSAATGGASGAYFEKTYTAAQIGASAAIVIGAAGAAGGAGQNNGSAGGNTSFTPAGGGSVLLAIGGGGGPFGITATIPNRGGFLAGSGNATGGDLNIAGQPGSIPLLFGGSAYTAVSGNGGNSVWAAGGQSSQENAAGNIAKGYGAGGGGGAALTISTAGGAGYQGLVIITEYIRVA